MTEVVTFGEAMLLLQGLQPGPLQLNSMLRTSIAGAEATVAIGLARLGHSVTWVGRVGSDDGAALIRSTLAAAGVTGQVIEDPDRPTGMLLRVPRLPGYSRVSYFRHDSAGSGIRTADVAPAMDPLPRIVHATGITAALGAAAEVAVREVLGQAHAAGALVSFDVNLRARLTTVAAAGRLLAGLLGDIDILVLGEDELAVLAAAVGADELSVADALALDRTAGQGHARWPDVIVKRGEHGASAQLGGQVFHTPAVPCTVVDTVGAGDAFTAGYLSGVLDELAPGDRLARAAAVAGFCVMSHGDWEGLPTRAELPVILLPSGITDR